MADVNGDGWRDLISLTDKIELDRPIEDTLLEFINLVNPDLPEGPLTQDNVKFGGAVSIPVETDTKGPNSKLTLLSLFGKGYRGNAEITYNRINLEEYFNKALDTNRIFIPNENFYKIEDVIDYYNNEFFLKLQKDHFKDLDNPVSGNSVILKAKDNSLLYEGSVGIYLFDRDQYSPAQNSFKMKVNPYNNNGSPKLYLRFTGDCGKINVDFGDGGFYYSQDKVSERTIEHEYYPDDDYFEVNIEVIEGENISMEIGGAALEEVVSFGHFPNIKHVSFSIVDSDIYSANLIKVPDDIPSFLTDASAMFAGASSFDQDISSWNTSNIVNMSRMFYNAVSFNSPIPMWNTSAVENMSNMFYKASSFDQDISSWNTSKVINMSGMFSYAIDFNKSINYWDVSVVKDMSNMFYYASSFNQALDGWHPDSVNDVDTMFSGATSFDGDLSGWHLQNISHKPAYFAYGAPLDNHPDRMPVWG